MKRAGFNGCRVAAQFSCIQAVKLLQQGCAGCE